MWILEWKTAIGNETRVVSALLTPASQSEKEASSWLLGEECVGKAEAGCCGGE